MAPTDYTRAVVDRIVDEQVVLLLEDEDERGELVVPVTDLPESAREDGNVVTVEREDGEVRAITYDEAATTERRERVQEKLDRLSRPLSEEDGKD